ncbi:MAG: hypothetical protein V4690_03710 [Patescibacteria group bacterium]
MSRTATIALPSRELEFKKTIFAGQLINIAGLACAAAFVWVVGYFYPNFFQHPNLRWSVPEGVITYFWPLLLYAASLAIVVTLASGISSGEEDEAVFGLSLVTGTLAGVWEEIGYRWLYICTAMVSITALNWLLGTFAGSIIGLVILIFGLLILINAERWNKFVALVPISFGALILWMIWYGGYSDPVFWIYQNITVPLVNFVTLGNFEMVFNHPNLSPLFVFGIIAANASFRDGHKYQGPVGLLNSWIVGFVMMYATIFYGIGTAIVLHALYNIEVALVRYLARKLSR